MLQGVIIHCTKCHQVMRLLMPDYGWLDAARYCGLIDGSIYPKLLGRAPPNPNSSQCCQAPLEAKPFGYLDEPPCQ